MSLNLKPPTNDNNITDFFFLCTCSCPICTRLKTLPTNLRLTHHCVPRALSRTSFHLLDNAAFSG